jgi:hypothetical protein
MPKEREWPHYHCTELMELPYFKERSLVKAAIKKPNTRAQKTAYFLAFATQHRSIRRPQTSRGPKIKDLRFKAATKMFFPLMAAVLACLRSGDVWLCFTLKGSLAPWRAEWTGIHDCRSLPNGVPCFLYVSSQLVFPMKNAELTQFLKVAYKTRTGERNAYRDTVEMYGNVWELIGCDF